MFCNEFFLSLPFCHGSKRRKMNLKLRKLFFVILLNIARWSLILPLDAIEMNNILSLLSFRKTMFQKTCYNRNCTSLLKIIQNVYRSQVELFIIFKNAIFLVILGTWFLISRIQYFSIYECLNIVLTLHHFFFSFLLCSYFIAY